MSGLLHLLPVPKVTNPEEDRIARVLRKAIRKFCDTDHGRMIPIEDECFKLLSWFPITVEHSYLVRVANVDGAGKPFAQNAFADGLYSRVCEQLDGNGYDLTTEEQADQYGYRYHPDVFKGTDFLYVPNSLFCNTLIAVRGFR